MGDASAGAERKAADIQDSSQDGAYHPYSDSGDASSKDVFPELSALDASRAERGPGKRSKNASLNGRLSKGYIDLVNSQIEDASDPSLQDNENYLVPSQIGGSYWTSVEKSAFYGQLSLSGPGELQKLAYAIGTKTEPEIRAYILLLQEGVREVELTLKRDEHFSIADIPAAHEISEECEQAAALAAENLSRRLENADAKQEQEEFGEWWLIDRDVAEVVEECFDDFEPPRIRPEIPRDPSGSADSIDADDTSPQPIEDNQDVEQPDLPFPAAQLLVPTRFLQLSSNLFMNSATDSEANWHNLVDPNDPQSGPAIYQTAFGDLHNLTVSLTRRLVQASIFQAMTRLRASSDARSQPNVIGADVKAALAVLGMSVDRTRYWATAPTRCGVEVYSDSKEFRDGRPRNTMGSKLTYDEAEAKLGMDRKLPTPESEGEVEIGDSDIDALEYDSDAFTNTGTSDGDLALGLPPKEEDADADVVLRGRTSKRKRALSPRSYERVDDRMIEAKDRTDSLDEENHLRQMLGLETLSNAGLSPPTELPYKRLKAEHRTGEWRDRVEYEAHWERQERVSPQAFQSMELEGLKGRRRRGIIRQALRARLNGQDRGSVNNRDEMGTQLTAPVEDESGDGPGIGDSNQSGQ